MKKYLSVILGIILTACLVACGSSNKDSVNDDKQMADEINVYFDEEINNRLSGISRMSGC